MKPLTLEELKSLRECDWVWVEIFDEIYAIHHRNKYGQIEYLDEERICFFEDEAEWNYSDYGKTWLAYKNKEQAEGKGEIVELPCKVGDIFYLPQNKVFDSTDRTYKSGALPYMVTNIGYSINKKKEVKTSVRLCLFIDGKTHDAQENMTFKQFMNKCYADRFEAEARLKELRGEL